MIKFYPFELHTHTKYSDGSMSPRTLVDLAVLRGLTGIAITDHNTTAGVEEVIRYGKQKGLIVIPGIEWTTFYGHITVLGGNTTVDWREINLENINEKARQTVDKGDIINLAHPKREGSPFCSGCYNEFKIQPKLLAGYEVWSNHKPYTRVSNRKAYQEYDYYCLSGAKLACLYGDDWHNEKESKKMYGITFLGIDGEVTVDKAIEAIKRRRTYISTGLVASINLRQGDKSYEIGDTIPQGEYTIEVEIKQVEDYCKLHNVIAEDVIIKGNAINQETKLPITNGKIKVDNLKLSKGYIRIEVSGKANNEWAILLITSPYYVEELC